MTRSFRRGLALAGAGLLLWGCGTFPLRSVYILGDPDQPTAGVADEAGLPHIDLRTVTVPDYLDTTDIVRRKASNQVITSVTGQWGERLSLGVTRALANDLSKRLPNIVVDSRRSYTPARRLLVNVDRFEIGEDGRCTLTASWRLTSPGERSPANTERGTFVETATSSTDAAATQAMTLAIDQLASRIVATLTAPARDLDTERGVS
jgi:uncharacterized lipoprotein YmbA